MKQFAAVVFLGLIASGSAVSFLRVIKEEWEAFKSEHGKKYANSIEEHFRMKIFKDNMHKVALHNKMYFRGEKNFLMKINSFSDLLHHEFVALMNGYRGNGSRPRHGSTFIGVDDDIALPNNIDWREKGAVTPVADQMYCGSCWAFSAVGSLEGQHFRKTGKLVNLSEQNLIDCSTQYGNYGCFGGLTENAFDYIRDNGGINTEESYPYDEMGSSTCRYEPKYSGAESTGYVVIPQGDEHALKKAIATIGPVSVAIDASWESFYMYSKGVYYEPLCSSDFLHHAVLVVGYGTSEKGEDYWLIKNSWGKDWGDEGYMQIARNRSNHCGIATVALFPLV